MAAVTRPPISIAAARVCRLWRRILPIAAAGLSLLALPGCFDLFRPAKPPAPTEGGGFVQTNYGSPDKTLETVALAMAAKGTGNGQDAYLRGFAELQTDGVEFTTVFDPEVLRRYQIHGGTVPSWNHDLEKHFYSLFVTDRVSPLPYFMVWDRYDAYGDDEPPDPVTGIAILHRKYTVYTRSNDALGTVAVGIANLTFRRNPSGLWKIAVWEDHVDPEVTIDPSDPNALCMSRRRLELQ